LPLGVKGSSNPRKDVFGGKENKIPQNRHNFSKKTRKSPYVDYNFQHVANTWYESYESLMSTQPCSQNWLRLIVEDRQPILHKTLNLKNKKCKFIIKIYILN
jgi:hypothetical protein